MPVLAAPCSGHDPLVFEHGRCFMCGRLLASELGTLEEAAESLGYAALGAAVARVEAQLRREAADAGYLDTPERYAQWLHARAAADQRREQARQERQERRSRAETPEDGPEPALRSVGASVRSPLAPVCF